MLNDPKFRGIGCAVLVLAVIVAAVHYGANTGNSSPTPLFASGGGTTQAVGKLPSSYYGSPASAGSTPQPASTTGPAASSQTQLSSQPAAPTTVQVDVAGAVRHPGVYTLPNGARNNDALKAAGGPTKQANTNAVNLAALAVDGTQLYFPTKKEQPTGGAADASALPAQTGTYPASASVSAASPRRSGRSRRGSKAKKLKSPSQGQVNINTASAGQLQMVPDIGPAMAARIIAFRQQNRGFATLKDLRNVKGIGPKKWAKMSPFLKVK